MGTSSRGGALRQALEGILPSERFGDERVILAGTSQNVVGLVVAMLATFGTQILITRTLGATAFGIVTVATQAGFVLAAATRFGMDMAAVRRVAIHMGAGEREQVRGVVDRAVVIATAVSVVVALLVFLFADDLGSAFTSVPETGTRAFQAASLTLVFAALVQVYLGGTRGLKIMRHTLYVFWVGQPVSWILFILAGWLVARSVGTTTLAYSVSWALATFAAAVLWHRETRGFGHAPVSPGEVGSLLRYGTPRAPAALLSQALFWTDLFVLAAFAASTEVGVYAAAVRAGQVVLLFLISVNYMFSPFVADLHARGQLARLGDLFKKLTRWTLAATLPVLIVLAAAPDDVLRLFGAEFAGGETALLILVVGQVVNVATGSVGFILIMVGRTGWDLVVYAGSVAFDVAVAVALVPSLGMEGAAIAGALTLAISNVARLLLVWRFLRVQPYTRNYLRLVAPAAAGFLSALGVHALLAGMAWQVGLVATAVAGGLVYFALLFAVGLPPGERRVARLLLNAALRRSGEPA